ncbi:MAG: hypothetical protein OEU50_02285 [Gammaproteobacteria bacterium]|nr:hypothetical protein [Gammaproteobacteria bacterium]
MKFLSLVTLIPILLALSGCAGGGRTYLAADEDEDYGIGGTGIVAQNVLIEGIGVIGEITGFGSIFVNGIEVEDDASTIISVNGRKVANHEFDIGEVVEVLTRDEQPLTGAVLINIRHEVIGPVSEIDRIGKRLTILNQEILLEDLPANIEAGAFLAVSGFRDGDGRIHATHVAATKPGSVLLRGQPDRRQNGLSMHGFDLAFAVQPRPDNHKLKIEGILAQGKINVTRAFPDRITSLKGVSTWVVQGFPVSYASAWKDNEGLKKISGQPKPVIFRVRYADENKPAKVMLLPDNLPKGAAVSTGRENSRRGHQSAPERGGANSSGNGNSSGKNGNSSGGGGKP